MLRNALLSILVLLTVAGALLEGFLESIPTQFIQVNGILIIFCTFIFIAWVVKFRSTKTG